MLNFLCFFVLFIAVKTDTKLTLHHMRNIFITELTNIKFTRGPLTARVEEMLKSAVIEEKKFKHSSWAGADNPLVSKCLCQQEGLITMVIYCMFEKNLFNL